MDIFASFGSEFVRDSNIMPNVKLNHDAFKTGHAVAGPEATIQTEFVAVAGQELADIMDEKTKLLLYSRINYKDVFNSRVVRFSEACILIEGETYELLADSERRMRFRCSPVGERNTAK